MAAGYGSLSALSVMLSSGDIDELDPTQGNFPRKNVSQVCPSGDSFARARLLVVLDFHCINRTKRMLCDDGHTGGKAKAFL